MKTKFFVLRVVICWLIVTILGYMSLAFSYAIAGVASDFAKMLIGGIPVLGSVICGALFLGILFGIMSVAYSLLTVVCFFLARDTEAIYFKALFGAGATFAILAIISFVCKTNTMFTIFLLLYGVFYMYLGYISEK